MGSAHHLGDTDSTDSPHLAATPPASAAVAASMAQATHRPAVKPTISRTQTRLPRQESAVRGWVVVETLTGTTDQISLVLDHDEPRSFSKLARASLPRSFLETLVTESLQSGCTRDKTLALDDNRVFRLVAIPIIGPSGGVFAVAVWSASILEPVPQVPIVGAVEWTPSGLLTTNPAAEYLLRPPNEIPGGRTVVELLASFDRWDDRLTFLDMFNFRDPPADRWTGIAAKGYEDGSHHQFHIAARAVGTGDQRRVRAIVCDVTATQTPCEADLSVIALRHMPILPGHAFALVDLKTAIVHEWLTEEHSALAGWRHHNPLYDRDGRELVAATCYDLARGVRDHITIEVRVRFTPTDNWVDLLAAWSRLPSGMRPQAILNLTPISPNPPPPVSGCGICYDITHPTAPDRTGPDQS